MIPLAVVALMFAACMGAGAAVLNLLGTLRDLDPGERAPWSFTVGMGAIGWIVFFPAAAGVLDVSGLLASGIVASAGLILLRGEATTTRNRHEAPNAIGRTLLAAIVVVLFFDMLEGMSPPADADTLSYHFALPKQFLEAGRLEFVPRAGTGAAPLLLQMTYMLALALGGELALTLWTMASSWMAAALLFSVCRRHLDLNWSLAMALLFLTTPAVLYGGGSGQVEARLVLFALAAAVAAQQTITTGRWGWGVLAGLLVGFYAGAKFMGLLFAAATGIALLLGRGWFRRGAVFGLVVLVAGFQWYSWNWMHTGDPTFPVLFKILNLPDSTIWNRAHDAIYRQIYFGAESPLPTNLFWYLAYPFAATLGYEPGLEASRTGLGPYGLLVFPFALAGAWRFRSQLVSSPLRTPALIVFLFYTFWFFSGTSQRIRHLLPVYPLLLLCIVVAATRWTDRRSLRRPLVVATGIAILVQLGGQGVFALNYARHVFSGESREAFLRRNVANFDVALWINQHLTSSDRVMITETQLIYPLKVPNYFAHSAAQVVVDLTARTSNSARFVRQIAAQGVTHILVPANAAEEPPTPVKHNNLPLLVDSLREAGCATLIKHFQSKFISSRTLAGFGKPPTIRRYDLVKVDTGRCGV